MPNEVKQAIMKVRFGGRLDVCWRVADEVKKDVREADTRVVSGSIGLLIVVFTHTLVVFRI